MQNPSFVVEGWSERPSDERKSALSELEALLSNSFAADRLSERISSPMQLEQLEMLEAELKNQGILPKGEATTLAQHALHSASILRWRAQRGGITGDNIEFVVDVPEYLLRRAEEIEKQLIELGAKDNSQESELFLRRSSSWGKAYDNQTRLLQDLGYLERFASYLLGKFDEDGNRYERGLNLILRIIAARNPAYFASRKTRIELPMDVKQFSATLRALTD